MLQLVLLREGLRDVPQMAGMLKGWSDRDLQDVAAHYGAAQPLRGERRGATRSFTQRGAGLAKAMGCGQLPRAAITAASSTCRA